MIISKFKPTEKETLLLEEITSKYESRLIYELELEKQELKEKNLSDLFTSISENELTINSEEDLQAIKEEVRASQEELEREIFFAALLDTLLETSEESYFQLENLSSDELLKLYNLLNGRIARRYFESINFDTNQMLKDAREVLEAYTLTDLLKDYRANSKNLRQIYVSLKIIPEKKETVLYSTLEGRMSLFHAVCFLIGDEIENTIAREVGLPVIYPFGKPIAYVEKTDSIIEIDEQEFFSDIKESSSYIPLNVLRENITAETEFKLVEIEELRFTQLSHQFEEKQERERSYSAKYRHKKFQENSKQIGIEDLFEENSQIQKLPETQKQVLNPLMKGLATTSPKSRKEILSFGQRINEYKNSIITLTIGMKNNKLLQLTNSSIPFYFACVAELVKKFSSKDIKEDFFPRISIPTRELFELFGVDIDNDIQRNHFLTECRTNADIWRIASVSAIDKDHFFKLSSLLPTCTIDKNSFTVGFTPDVARALLDSSQTQFVNLPKVMYRLDNISWQLVLYLNWQSQMYKNIDNNKSSVKIIDSNTIEIKRSVDSILNFVSNLNSDHKLETDRKHFLRDVGERLEDRLITLTETPLSEDTSTPVIKSWSYEGNTKEHRKTVSDRNDFSTPEEWINTNIVFRLPLPGDFIKTHDNYLEQKNESKKRFLASKKSNTSN